MAANSLHADFDELKGAVASALGWNLTVASWSTQQDSLFDQINKRAYGQANYPEPLEGERVGHTWSWLRPKGVLTLNAPYATGTVGVAADAGGSIVTLASGTWPSWAASGDLWVDGERYTVKSRTNDSVILLDNVSVTVSSGTSYELIQHEYALPTDFGGMASNAFVVRRDQTECGYIPLVTPIDLALSDRSINGQGAPSKAAIVPVVPTATTDSQWMVQFADPFPRDDLRLEYRYKAIPPLLDGSTYVYHYGGAMYSRMFLASYVDVAYDIVRKSTEKHGDFLVALRQAVMFDRANFAPHSYGKSVPSVGPRTFDPMDYINRRRAQTTGVTFQSIGAV